MTLRPIPVQRVDWFQVLMDLKRAGLSSAAVAAMVVVSKSTVIGWKNLGAEPKHVEGERLVELWCRATGLTRDKLPVDLAAGQRPVKRVHPAPARCPCCGDPYTPKVKRAALVAEPVPECQVALW